MPCRDVTEILTINIDTDNHVTSYSLTKQTCGGIVGNQRLIADWLQKKSISEILAMSHEKFLSEITARSILNEFLHLKHFLAVKSGLSVLNGIEKGGAKDYCAIGQITCNGDGSLTLSATIQVDILTEKIQACGNCGTCSSH